MLLVLSAIAVVATAIAAGLGYFSFWWVLAPAFLAGALSIANGPGFNIVMAANYKGDLSVLPRMLAYSIIPWLIVGGIAFWISALISN